MDEKKDYFLIEKVAEDDWIGFDSYLYSLESAIYNGAKFIGLIADYGTGKSTLINMLSKKQELINSKLIKIDLWNCCNNNPNNNQVDIHRIFLHQLIDKLNISSAGYFKKKIDKNYSIFDIKFKQENLFYGIMLAFYYILCIFDKLGFIVLFDSDLELIGYSLIAILTFISIIIYKPVVAFKKPENTARVIDENDTKDLYNEIIYEYSQKNSKIKNLIICLEELDRYDNPDIILEYLKEFYKFYKEPTNSKNKINIVFIVSLKSANQLYNLYDCTEQTSKDDLKLTENNNIKEIYEKIFDFIVNLNQISIHDYDAIIMEIVNAKRNQMPDGIKIPTQKTLKSWRYLYKGKHIRIRDIKHRYNFSISLYLSVKESGIQPNFDKCLFISYLEDEYNELYEDLINKNLIGSTILDYANGKRDFTNELSGYKDAKMIQIYNDVLLEGLDSKYISVDYNYYFYKFPKNKKSYNIYEYELYNAVFFDIDSKNLSLSIKRLKESQIKNILEKRANGSFIPVVVFKYPELIKIAYSKDFEAFHNTLIKKFDLINNFEQFQLLIEDLKKLNKNKFKAILYDYFESYLPIIKELNKENIFELRKRIVKELRNESIVINDIFMGDNYIISAEELNNIDNFEIAVKLTNFSSINEICLASYIRELRTRKISKQLVIKLLVTLTKSDKVSNEMYNEFFYSIKLNEYQFRATEHRKIFEISREKLNLNNIENYNKFLNYINYYDEKMDDFYLKLLKNNDNTYNDILKYKSYLEKSKKIYTKSMKMLDDYSKSNTVLNFTEDIRQQFYQNGYYQYYVISTRLNKGIFEIENDKLENLGPSYIKEYEYRKPWKCNVGNDMKMYLYENVNMSKLDESRLSLFQDLSQRKDIIEAVLATQNDKFINNYLSKINRIELKDLGEIFELIGNYNRNKGLKKYAKNNLKKLTKKQKFLNMLDARRRIQ